MRTNFVLSILCFIMVLYSTFLTRSGVLGEILSVQVMGGSYSRIMLEYGVKEFDPAWRGRRQYGGGVLYDFGAHTICFQFLYYIL